jgi:hypothetical protein
MPQPILQGLCLESHGKKTNSALILLVVWRQPNSPSIAAGLPERKVS